MQKATSVEMRRDKNGKIIGYTLREDKTKMLQQFTPSEVKEHMRSNRLDVNNLTLTSDGRLVQTNKNVPNVATPARPVTPTECRRSPQNNVSISSKASEEEAAAAKEREELRRAEEHLHRVNKSVEYAFDRMFPNPCQSEDVRRIVDRLMQKVINSKNIAEDMKLDLTNPPDVIVMVDKALAALYAILVKRGYNTGRSILETDGLINKMDISSEEKNLIKRYLTVFYLALEEEITLFGFCSPIIAEAILFPVEGNKKNINATYLYEAICITRNACNPKPYDFGVSIDTIKKCWNTGGNAWEAMREEFFPQKEYVNEGIAKAVDCIMEDITSIDLIRWIGRYTGKPTLKDIYTCIMGMGMGLDHDYQKGHFWGTEYVDHEAECFKTADHKMFNVGYGTYYNLKGYVGLFYTACEMEGIAPQEACKIGDKLDDIRHNAEQTIITREYLYRAINEFFEELVREKAGK